MRQETMGLWEAVNQLDHMQTMRTLLQTDNHTNTSSLHFYRLDALPDAQSTEGTLQCEIRTNLKYTQF